MAPERTAHGLRDAAGDEPNPLVRWRLYRLLESGFPQALAWDLATTPGVDLHALLDLVDRGCPPHLAVRILAPAPDWDLSP